MSRAHRQAPLRALAQRDRLLDIWLEVVDSPSWIIGPCKQELAVAVCRGLDADTGVVGAVAQLQLPGLVAAGGEVAVAQARDLAGGGTGDGGGGGGGDGGGADVGEGRGCCGGCRWLSDGFCLC